MRRRLKVEVVYSRDRGRGWRMDYGGEVNSDVIV